MTGQTIKVIEREPAQPKLSKARKVTAVPVPLVAVGVPVMAPVFVSKLNPPGRVPLVMAKV